MQRKKKSTLISINKSPIIMNKTFCTTLVQHFFSYSCSKVCSHTEICLQRNLLYGLHVHIYWYNMSVYIPLGNLSPDPCQQICFLLGGETAVRTCGSAGTKNASINTSDVNERLQFSRGECLYLCVHDYTCVRTNVCVFECVLVSDWIIAAVSNVRIRTK